MITPPPSTPPSGVAGATVHLGATAVPGGPAERAGGAAFITPPPSTPPSGVAGATVHRGATAVPRGPAERAGGAAHTRGRPHKGAEGDPGNPTGRPGAWGHVCVGGGGGMCDFVYYCVCV